MASQLKRKLCLVVSDATFLGDCLSTFLSTQGYETEFVDGFDRAFARYEASNPDFIVVDCRRQIFEALVFMQRVRWRANKSKIPIFWLCNEERPSFAEHLFFKRDEVFLVHSLSAELLSDVFHE